MRTKVLDETDQRTYAVVFEATEEALSGLEAFAAEAGLAASRFSAIGGFSEATVGFFKVETRQYEEIPVPQTFV